MKSKSLPPVKCVDYSYPTSTNAVRFGFHKGCWTVNLTTFSETCGNTKAVAGFATFAEARAHAETLPNEWASWVNRKLALHEAMSLAVGKAI